MAILGRNFGRGTVKIEFNGQQHKKVIRERILALLRKQKEEERLTKSWAIKDKLIKMREFQKAKSILFYASFDGEVDTFEMMKEAEKLGITIGLPRIADDKKTLVPTGIASLENDLQSGPYGIQQPKSSLGKRIDNNELDMVIVPGVAFDRQNNRLGRGKGYYDRFLGSLPPNVLTVGLAFDFQIVDSLRHQQAHDIPTACVLTN